MSAPATWLPFRVPEGAVAAAPPEARGLDRDGVRRLVARPGRETHATARDLPAHLEPGDLLVVNTSATLPAAVDVTHRGRATTVHVSTQLDGPGPSAGWVIEVRSPDGRGYDDVGAGEVLRLPGGQRLRVVEPHPAGQGRLWRAIPVPATPSVDYLTRHGHPIRYPYLDGAWPLEAFQNVYADVPGSAEMPSAGRPLTEHLLVRLMARGVAVVPLVLHTGVASQESAEPPQPERFVVPEATARLVNSTRAVGRRVVAVGTTVVRALESCAGATGTVTARTGWTDLVLDAARPARVVDGLLTGLHEPEASHLHLLESVAGPPLVASAYAAATEPLAPTYLWHEFGDVMLLLP
ncbi:MAG: S-adenosylmethionine:tRNA ribosyltransferase-isomerase [Nocardioidaceae bacterium]